MIRNPLCQVLVSIAALLPCAVAVAAAAAAAAADIPAALRIERVTVYRQGAVVTRSGLVALPAGTSRVLLPGLPAGIDPKNLQVAIGGGARLGGIEVQQINAVDYASEDERTQRRRIEELSDRRAAVLDDAATAELQLKLLEALAVNPAGDPAKPGLTAPNLAAVLATVGTGSAAARKRVRESGLHLRGLDREIDTLKADLAKIATRSRQSTAVLVSVDAGAATTAMVTVAYAVTDAGWQWIYEARLDTTQLKVTLQREGQVRQGTGEDWKEVELTLSTALPSDDVATPEVGSVFLDLRGPLWLAGQPANAARGVAPIAAPAPVAQALQSVMVSAHRREASEAATQYVADYRIPARVTLRADREARLYPIGEDVFDVRLIARVIPRAGRTAHLEASFTYPRDVPLEAGGLQLYRDGAYVGEAATAAVLPGAAVNMPFGADERVHVEIRDEPARSGERGLIGRQMVRETRRRFDVTSHHPMPIEVEIVDRLPVSQSAEVRVDTLTGATEPSRTDVDGKAGVLAWRFEAPPLKTVSVRHYYAIEYPRDRQLSETFERAD